MQTVRLGIDFGTSHTVAVLARPGGRVDALLFEASPLLPSAVYLGGDGTMLVGRDAERSARIEPSAYEPHPKRRIDEGSVLLNEREVPVPRLIEAILRRVADEAVRVLGGPPGATVLTHPAGWGATRRALLSDAAAAAGLPAVSLVAEPVAAAMYFTGALGHRVPEGHAVVVYDFGGGTFDVSVLRRTGDGWHVAAAAGLDDVGGIDLDAAVVERIRVAVAARGPELWHRLERPGTVADRRHRRALWEDARSTKELLSRATTAGLTVPLLDVDLYLTRPEFEALARPWLDRTVALTTATLFASDVTAGRLAGVFLVGGGSRVPLVATLLHQALGIAPVILEQPELVVAQGSLLAAEPVPVKKPEPKPAPAKKPEPTPEPPPVVEKRRRPWGTAAFAAVAAVGGISLLARDSYGDVAPPLLAGLLTPLLPGSVLVLLAMVVAMVIGGPPAPAHRALGPAVVAAAGTVLGLLVLWPLRDAVEVWVWVLAGSAVAILIGGLYAVARPARRVRIGLWAAAGVVLVLAGSGPVRMPYVAFNGDHMANVQPLSGVIAYDGDPTWFGGYLFGVALMLAAALSLGAALRQAIGRTVEVHQSAAEVHQRIGAVLVAQCGALLLLDVAWQRSEDPMAEVTHQWYWSTFVRVDDDGLPWVWLLLAVAAVTAVVVPSLVRSARARQSGAVSGSSSSAVER
ncbi:Hsp70 family protein [Dactylosporangium sp. NPDC049140]|uniref:Hsp70 family protein n=1 Tax=Dactylosporangium sp. NPDC049140 TaxID=3155647 RepID=UPI0033C2DC7D